MIDTTTNLVTYNTNGSTVNFAVNYPFWESSELVVKLQNTTTLIETTLTISTDYTVTGGDGETGTVTTVATYASGYKLQIKRVMSLKQKLDLSDNDEFPAESVEESLDKLEAQIQQISTDQSFNLRGSSFTTGFDFTLPAPLADQYLKVNSTNDGYELGTLPDPSILVKASNAEVIAGTDDAKYVSCLGVQTKINALSIPSPTGKGLQIVRANTGGTANEYSGVTISTDGTMASNSDAKVSTEKAVKTYAQPVLGYVKVSDVKAYNVSGGTPTAGAWTTHDINTEVHDASSICSISSNKISLSSGRYTFQAKAVFYRTDEAVLRLYNFTDSSEISLGEVIYSGGTSATSTTSAFVSGEFTLATTKEIVLQYRAANAVANGLGFATLISGISSIYATVEFCKIG